VSPKTFASFLCIFANLQLQERYLPIITGAGMPFPCVPRHFNYWSTGVAWYCNTGRGRHGSSVAETDNQWRVIGSDNGQQQQQLPRYTHVHNDIARSSRAADDIPLAYLLPLGHVTAAAAIQLRLAGAI